MKLIRSIYINTRFFQGLTAIAVLFVLSFIFPALIGFIKLGLLIFILTTAIDSIRLYNISKGITGHRICADRLSNGDENPVLLELGNSYSFKVHVEVIDEIPHQFQKRDVLFSTDINSGHGKTIEYFLRPVKRGEYSFGAVNIFAKSSLGLVSRRYQFAEDTTVPVYPSYLQMQKYELLAISNNLTEFGIKKIRRIGHNMEFDHIKSYVSGDDYRTINWKATARKSKLMVNLFQDERSQQVYSLIDKGRVMKMPFMQMSLLDYAINASLVISNIAIKKDDKAGLITFQHKIGTIVPASKRNKQMKLIMDNLYHQKTAYKESDFGNLYAQIKRNINQRSLLLLFTNFESMSALQRQLPFLRRISHDHLLVTIFFKNTELNNMLHTDSTNIEDVYNKIIAEKFTLEKKQIAKTLQNHGIHTILTEPENLTVDTINKYLELKSRGLI